MQDIGVHFDQFSIACRLLHVGPLPALVWGKSLRPHLQPFLNLGVSIIVIAPGQWPVSGVEQLDRRDREDAGRVAPLARAAWWEKGILLVLLAGVIWWQAGLSSWHRLQRDYGHIGSCSWYFNGTAHYGGEVSGARAAIEYEFQLRRGQISCTILDASDGEVWEQEFGATAKGTQLVPISQPGPVQVVVERHGAMVAMQVRAVDAGRQRAALLKSGVPAG